MGDRRDDEPGVDARRRPGGPEPAAGGSGTDPRAAQDWRGQRLGLPPRGPGSLAPAGRRLAAFAVDLVLSALVAGLFTAPEPPRNWSLAVFAAEYLTFTLAFGQTPGMRLVGVRIVRVDRPVRIGAWRAVLRTFLLILLVPALIWNSDTRCLHDRVTDTAVVLT